MPQAPQAKKPVLVLAISLLVTIICREAPNVRVLDKVFGICCPV